MTTQLQLINIIIIIIIIIIILSALQLSFLRPVAGYGTLKIGVANDDKESSIFLPICVISQDT